MYQQYFLIFRPLDVFGQSGRAFPPSLSLSLSFKNRSYQQKKNNKKIRRKRKKTNRRGKKIRGEKHQVCKRRRPLQWQPTAPTHPSYIPHTPGLHTLHTHNNIGGKLSNKTQIIILFQYRLHKKVTRVSKDSQRFSLGG